MDGANSVRKVGGKRLTSPKKSASPKKHSPRKLSSPGKKSPGKKSPGKKSPGKKSLRAKSASPKKAGSPKKKAGSPKKAASPKKKAVLPARAVSFDPTFTATPSSLTEQGTSVPEELRKVFRHRLNEMVAHENALAASVPEDGKRAKKLARAYTDKEVRAIGQLFIESLYEVILDKGRREPKDVDKDGNPKKPAKNVTFPKFFSFKLVQQKGQQYTPPPSDNNATPLSSVYQPSRYAIRMALQTDLKKRLEQEYKRDALQGKVPMDPTFH